MGKLQSDKLFILTHPKNSDKSPNVPPQIPPRMKKKGPALPEKPPHIRAKSTANAVNSSQLPPVREPLKPRILNLDKPNQREVLVAASKSGRERPVEKRQREPAKLLLPTSGSNKKELQAIILEETAPRTDPNLKGNQQLHEEGIVRKEIPVVHHPKKSWTQDETVPLKKPGKSRPLQPVLLIPRNLLSAWGSTAAPVSYALWSQRDVGRGVIRPVIKHHNNHQHSKHSETSDTSVVMMRSGSVTRSGSLTSQGSSSSDSGGETFPKSVLKKQKRGAANTHPSSRGNHASNRKVEPKKNVTFNAFATVQLMAE